MRVAGDVSALRWDPYFMAKGEQFDAFWRDHLNGAHRNVLYVLGKGFDPRMCEGLKQVMSAGGNGLRNCALMEFDEGPDSPSTGHRALVEDNLTILGKLAEGRGKILSKVVPMWSEDVPGRHRISSLSAANAFSGADIRSYSDIVVDISAMPRSIYFPLIGKLIYLLDKGGDAGESAANLHIIVCEDAELDRKIRDAGIDDDADYVHGFGGGLEMEASGEMPKVWIPILGEGQTTQLERIYALLVDPEEICPVLPSPSLAPRRSDELLIEYRDLLLDRWRVEPRNIIYAAEQNPFEAYRQIHRAVRHYRQALQPLGGCKAVVSALSSKLLSIGALLATYELNAAMAHVEAQGYQMSGGHETISDHLELFTLWVAGECCE